jgi:predicted Zn finger-like uncharacterized protein
VIISCSQCGTTYTLDDSLIPDSGASVQCTRCGSVFTARKGGEAAAAKPPAPAPSRPRAPAAREGSKTMIFGGDAGPGGKLPEPQATNKTMIFGGDAGPKPAAAPPNNPGSRTMIFGGAPPVADAPKPAANPGSRTMIFGGAPPVSGPDDKPAPAATNKTMIFGGDSKPAARPAAPAANPGSRTMIFGGAPVLTPDDKKKPEPKAPAPSGPRPEPQNPANKTMIFGGSPLAAEAKSKPKAGSQTMMFGAAPPLTSQTLQFGPPGQAPVTDDSGQVVFGADAARDKPSVLTEGTVRIDQAELDRMRREHESGAVTPSGGTGSLMDDDAPANPQKTQLFGAGLGPEIPDLSGEEAPPKAKHDKTLMFAGSGAKPEKPPEPARHQKTQLFAMGSKPPIPEPPGPSGHSEFEDFAAAIHAEDDGPQRGKRGATTDPALNQVDDTPSSVQVDASIVDTLEPDKVAALPPSREKPIRAGRRVTIDAPQLSPPDLLATTLPNRDAPQPSAGLELPPEDDAPQMFTPEALEPANPADEAAALKADLGRKNKIAALVIILVAVVMALGIAWAVVGKQLYGKLTGTEVPIEALASTERVPAQLRSDDAAARTAAVATLRGLIARYPRMLEAHAALVTALALDLDEAQDRARRTSASFVGFGVRVKALDTRSPDYERDRDVLTAAQKKLEPLIKPQQEAVGRATEALQAAMTELQAAVKAEPTPTPQASQAVSRGSALFYAARGEGLAVAQVEAWTRAGGQPEHDVWPQLAVPMFELNQKPQVQASVIEAQATLKEISGRELDLARAFVLLARARLDLGDLEGADETLDKLLGLRPEHLFGQELKRRVGEARLEANALKPKEAAPPAPAPELPGPQVPPPTAPKP